MEELVAIIKNLSQRIELLERQVAIRKVTIPTDGYLVVDSQTSDPPVKNGRIYYNTASNKFRKCANGAWADM